MSKPEAAPYDDFVRCAALQEQRATMPPGRTHPLAHDAIIARGVKFALLGVAAAALGKYTVSTLEKGSLA